MITRVASWHSTSSADVGGNKIFLGDYMDLQRHIAAIIRRHPNQADYCAERIVKLVEENFTSNSRSIVICPECGNSVSMHDLKALCQCPHCKVDYPFIIRGKQR
jgi:hypothetical protein